MQLNVHSHEEDACISVEMLKLKILIDWLWRLHTINNCTQLYIESSAIIILLFAGKLAGSNAVNCKTD